MAVASARAALGALGETLACAELTRRGYSVLARRYRTRRGEIDIIALHQAQLVFIEVKTRRHERCGAPAEAVTPAKRRRMEQVALAYLSERGWLHRPARFDVVSVWVVGHDVAEIEVLMGAC